MASKQENLVISAGLVRRLTRENRSLGTKLAGYELRRMLKELSNPTLFGLELDFPGEIASDPMPLPSIENDPVAERLAPLNVPLGSIVWTETVMDLVTLGIFIPNLPAEELRLALRALMTAHASDPFARLFFMCENFHPIPFLGRYGFAYDYLGKTTLEEAARRAQKRHGISEVRSVQGSKILWKASDDL